MRYALVNKYSIDDLEEEVNLAMEKGWICVEQPFSQKENGVRPSLRK